MRSSKSPHKPTKSPAKTKPIHKTPKRSDYKKCPVVKNACSMDAPLTELTDYLKTNYTQYSLCDRVPDVAKYMVDTIFPIIWELQMTDILLGTRMGAFAAAYGSAHGTGTTGAEKRANFYEMVAANKSAIMKRQDTFDPFAHDGYQGPVQAYCLADESCRIWPYVQLALELYAALPLRGYAIALVTTLNARREEYQESQVVDDMDVILDIMDEKTIRTTVKDHPRIKYAIEALFQHDLHHRPRQCLPQPSCGINQPYASCGINQPYASCGITQPYASCGITQPYASCASMQQCSTEKRCG